MSLIAYLEPTPSRVRALFRLLLIQKSREMPLDEAQRLLSPEPLVTNRQTQRPSRDMISQVIARVRLTGLITVTGDRIALAKDLPDEALDPDTGDQHLPKILLGRIASTQYTEVNDLALVLAWFLAQDPWRPLHGMAAFDKLLQDQVGPTRLDVTNKGRYDMFVDWAVYLGFCRLDDGMIVPDPTLYLQRRLPERIRDAKPHPLPGVLKHLAEVAPVLDGGSWRKQIESSVPTLAITDGTVSPSASLALMRLEEEGMISLQMQADAKALELRVSPGVQRRCSHLVPKWKGTR